MIPLRVLLLEDDPNDAELLLQELRQAGFATDWRRVDTEAGFLAELSPALDIILADYRQPQFNALRALHHLRERGLDIPFIVVTGLFEEVGLDCIQQGATDYLLKDRLGRLGPAITHALEQRRLREERQTADQILRASEQRFRALVEHSSDAIVLVDVGGVITYVAPSVARILGHGGEELGGHPLLDLVHPADRDDLSARLASLAQVPGESQVLHYRAQLGGGSWRYLEAVATNLIHEVSVGAIVINVRDVTERKQAEAALRESEERFRSLVQNVSDVISVFDADGIIRYLTPSSQNLLNYSPEELLGSDGWKLVHPDDVARVRNVVVRTLGAPAAMERIEFRVRRRDGSFRHVEASATNLLDDPSVRGMILTSRDVTERKRFEEQLRHQAFSDSLTGLPNRALFMDRLGHALDVVRRRAALVTVMFLDLDRFKIINDSLGHGAGDDLLVAVSERLSRVVRPDDTVARFGGDEFVLLIEAISDQSEALRIAERIRATFSQPFQLRNHEVFTSASIGIALSTPGSSTAEDLVRNADVALYQAKAQGRARFSLYDARMSAQAVERLELEEELRRAIEHGELRLYYQPEVDLVTGTTVGLEALLRWQHPRRGLLRPRAFIPLAEETGLIVPIGRWVLEEACRQACDWQIFASAGAPLIVSVNLSAREFQRPAIVEQVSETLRQTGLRPDALELEITESTMMSVSQSTSRTLRALKALGVRLAIDDFGTGYSSLSYLRSFPVDTLKIDQSFVSGIEREKKDRAIIEAVTGLAYALDMSVTAEGVETARQRSLLEQLRCTHGQGYYFSPALPNEDLHTLLQIEARSRLAAPASQPGSSLASALDPRGAHAGRLGRWAAPGCPPALP